MKLQGPLGSFSPGIGLPKYNMFILFIFIFKCEFEAHPKNSAPSSMSFQFLTGVDINRHLLP